MRLFLSSRSRVAHTVILSHTVRYSSLSTSTATASWFDQYKSEVQQNLKDPSPDRSLAGRVDPQIEELVNTICALPNLVTLSSCSGRFSLFHRGSSAPTTHLTKEETSATTETIKKAATSVVGSKRGSYGRGTLFQSHDPLLDVKQHTTDLMTAMQEFSTWRAANHSTEGKDVLELKFEPMILHIACRDMKDAAQVLVAANDAGQRRSGVLSMPSSYLHATTSTTAAVDSESTAPTDAKEAMFVLSQKAKKITVSVTSALQYNVPLLVNGVWITGESPLECPERWRQMASVWVAHANELFEENALRKTRFRNALLARVVS